ncbi:MAG: hypothetical protein AAF281_10670 [Pseudomonadota bacterium]
MPHDLSGHNAAADHLLSHPHRDEHAEDLQILATEFIDSFCRAADKSAYLELAGIPREIPDSAGGAPLKLVDVRLSTDWQVGTASPSFGSSELSYLPFPGPMIEERTNMHFVYVSLHRREAVDLRDHLRRRLAPAQPGS